MWNLLEFAKQNHNLQETQAKLKNIINYIKEQERNLFSLNQTIFRFSNLQDSWLDVFNIVLFIFIFTVTKQTPNKLMFYLSVFNLFSSSFSGFLSPFVMIKDFRIISNIMKEIITLNNYDIETQNFALSCPLVKDITINDQTFVKNFLFLTDVKFSLFNFVSNDAIKLNGIQIKKFNLCSLLKNIFYYSFNNLIFCEKSIFDVKFDDEFREQFIWYFNRVNAINPNQLNYLEKILLQLFKFTKLKEKILIFEFSFELDSTCPETTIFYELLSFINRDNFIIYINKTVVKNITNNYFLYE